MKIYCHTSMVIERDSLMCTSFEQGVLIRLDRRTLEVFPSQLMHIVA